jgi:predicted dehydrogenase
MTTTGIGIIGCGDIARARFPGFDLVGMQSRTTTPCEPLAQQYGGKVYLDLESLLGAPDVQAVVIATPHPTHANLAICCLEAGKHVLARSRWRRRRSACFG